MRSSHGSNSSYVTIGSSSNVRPRRYAQFALRASIKESQSDIFLEQLQRQRLHVVRLHFAEADQLVPAAISRIALEEEAHLFALQFVVRRRGDLRLEVSARTVELHHARGGVVVLREQL